MKKNNFLKTEKKASAIILVVLTVVILSLLGTGLLRLGLSSRVFAVRNANQIQARSAADAGLTKALFLMNKKLKANTFSDAVLPYATDESLSG